MKNKQKIKIGDHVSWICKPYRIEKFECQGVVQSFKKSCFGGIRTEQMGARVIVETSKYQIIMGKSVAFISLKNLKKTLQNI